MKVAILLATHNKEKELPNVLYSIARQKTSFPFEVCIVDDCSKVDPEPIIREFLPDAKYKRLDEWLPFDLAPNLCLDMVSDDVDVIVLMSSDVIVLQDDSIERLCERVGDKKVVFGEVVNSPVSEVFYEKFDKRAGKVLKKWEQYVNGQTKIQMNDPYCSKKSRCLYTGRNIPTSWLFFLGAITKKNLIDIGYRENSCDAVLAPSMKESGFDAEILTYVRGLHQNHTKDLAVCSVSYDECEFWCARTRKRISKPKSYFLKAKVVYERPK